MFCSSSVYGSKGRSKDYLPGQYHYNALCRGQIRSQLYRKNIMAHVCMCRLVDLEPITQQHHETCESKL